MNTIKQIMEDNGKGIHSMFNACMHKAECCSKDAEIAELKRQLEDKEGANDVQLAFDPNDARSKQQWKLDGKVEMGQLLGCCKNKASGNSEAEGRFALTDSFSGCDELLIDSSTALIELDAENALVPHGIGGHAVALMSALCVRFDNLKRRLAESQAREAKYRESLISIGFVRSPGVKRKRA